ncbi:hypothetical protein MYCTH_2077114 [Thermothelomyces thermophilus ATCC 42464]|uniref:Uncharacterized protein n=1 Tax=Thermothelomyces thermophilus (strain ATCC 42464 / BCRC 31852 / DSM 1799) TaxID=573729 RepID=G2QAS1_THET4|nr:uncharacterized protein MYCTH_2077114 [Thermothelomyces thermophilus ATCC 42464]AEO55913.1 hypothetical protein MYCTH_2077114 [Thermothelomyces thermophilus ATCC 42464]
MAALIRSLPAFGWLLAAVAGAATTEHERFAAVETGAVLAPRLYHMGPASPLEKREDGCREGWHPCNDIGPPGENACCPNDQYCIVNPSDTTTAGCCSIGARCRGSPCDPTAYQCNKTTTITAQGTPSVSLIPACCGRVCTGTSEFQCPTSLGGGCCKYGSRCGRDKQCIFTLTEPSPTPTPSTSIDPALIPPPPGCETGQTSCPASLGGGCCPATQSCTLITGKAHCADNPPEPTGSGVSVVDGADGGLSPGATAGVAVGVVVGAGAILGLAASWWCARRRRKGGGMSEATGSAPASRPTGVVGRIVGGSGGAGSAGREISDVTSDVASRSGRFGGGGGGGGLVQDYFGPAPAVGPYSETHTSSPVTTPGLDRGGVPLQPHEPGDIAVPVEIDSRLKGAEGPPAGLAITPRANAPHESEDVQEHYELYGSEVGQISPTLPSPYGEGVPSPHERPS